jgi:crotonobetainyl-CoA:carnitine CoA-transferase CaiB-like acyl-CoA transferase
MMAPQFPWRGPLQGVRVLDFTRVLAGPFLTQLLGDLGAEIIKIEAPGGGDETRHFPPFISGSDESHYFLAINRNKKSVVIDLKAPEGKVIIEDLVRKSDAVIENFRPGVMEKLGFGYVALSALNPSLVYCSVSGFGMTGPWKDQPSFDIVTQALSGVMSINGEPEQRPVKLGLPMGDMVGGIYGSIAVLSSLYECAKTGRGRHIDIGLFDGLLGLLGYIAQLYFVSGTTPKQVGSAHPILAPYGAFAASDGDLVIACLTNQFWHNFARALGRPDLIDDPRFASIDARMTNRAALDPIVINIIKQKTVAEWQRILDQHDVPHAPIMSVQQALEHPHATAREMTVTAEHERAGLIRMVGRPIKFVDAPQTPLAASPVYGRHTDELLSDLLGYGPERLAALKAAKVIQDGSDDG